MNLLEKTAKPSSDIDELFGPHRNCGRWHVSECSTDSNKLATIQDVADFINEDTGYYVMRITHVFGDWQIVLDSKTDRISVQAPSFDEAVEKIGRAHV